MYQKKLPHLTSAYFLFTLLTFLFVHLGLEIRENELEAFDTAVQSWIRAHHSPLADQIMLGITHSSSVLPVLGFILIACLLLYFKGHYRDLVFVLTTIPGTVILNTLLKLIFQRQRPDFVDLLVVEKFYSFPSGHAMISSAAILTLSILFRRHPHAYKILIGGALYTLLVGYSRVYLGVHYPSDIIGGWLISLAWVILAQKIVFQEGDEVLE